MSFHSLHIRTVPKTVSKTSNQTRFNLEMIEPFQSQQFASGNFKLMTLIRNCSAADMKTLVTYTPIHITVLLQCCVCSFYTYVHESEN